MASALHQAILMNYRTGVIPPDPYQAQVVFMAHNNYSTGLVDTKGHTITNTGPAGAIDGTRYPSITGANGSFYNSSTANTTNDLRASSADFNTLLAADFTIEFWLNVQTVNFFAAQTINIGTGSYGGTTVSDFNMQYYTNQIQMSFRTGGLWQSGVSPPTSTWQFWAISCTGGACRIYQHGTFKTSLSIGATRAYASTFISFTACYPGSLTASLCGSISEVRCTAGVGRYPSTCPVPTAIFSDT